MQAHAVVLTILSLPAVLHVYRKYIIYHYHCLLISLCQIYAVFWHSNTHFSQLFIVTFKLYLQAKICFLLIQMETTVYQSNVRRESKLSSTSPWTYVHIKVCVCVISKLLVISVTLAGFLASNVLDYQAQNISYNFSSAFFF